jgi:hypothetical protein
VVAGYQGGELVVKKDPALWLLDVDGVVNAVAKNVVRDVYADWVCLDAKAGGQLFPIKAAQPVLDFLREVHESGLAQIWWHTTWQEDAPLLGKQLGLPEFGVWRAPESNWNYAEHRSQWWKTPGALRAKSIADEFGSKFVWTDDDIPYELSKIDRPAFDGGLLVSPNQRHGLSPKELETIAAFLNG